jgi:hypothetical protein
LINTFTSLTQIKSLYKFTSPYEVTSRTHFLSKLGIHIFYTFTSLDAFTSLDTFSNQDTFTSLYVFARLNEFTIVDGLTKINSYLRLGWKHEIMIQTQSYLRRNYICKKFYTKCSRTQAFLFKFIVFLGYSKIYLR